MRQNTAVPIDRYPDPACSYHFEDGSPVIRDHNDRFGGICGLEAGDSLNDLFDSGLSAGSVRPAFERTERVWVSDGSGTRYLVRVVAPTESDPGYLLFTTADGEARLGVDRMASVLSHDLRNPLDVARARLRAGRELDEDEQFEHVEQAHDRMERIIQDVLTLARGEDVVTPEQQADLDGIAREAWQTVETDGAQIDVTDGLPTVVVDEDRASRLFENLFRNAVEHGSTSRLPGADDAVEHGSASRLPEADDAAEHDSAGTADAAEHTVTVTVGRVADGVYVADDGPGIPDEDRERVFEPGFSSEEHGTGLGLAIVERIADLHGWSVRVRESQDGGARFEITGMQ